MRSLTANGSRLPAECRCEVMTHMSEQSGGTLYTWIRGVSREAQDNVVAWMSYALNEHMSSSSTKMPHVLNVKILFGTDT